MVVYSHVDDKIIIGIFYFKNIPKKNNDIFTTINIGVTHLIGSNALDTMFNHGKVLLFLIYQFH